MFRLTQRFPLGSSLSSPKPFRTALHACDATMQTALIGLFRCNPTSLRHYAVLGSVEAASKSTQ